MTKIEELKATLAAATPGEWVRRGSQIHCRRALLAKCQFGPDNELLDPEAANDAEFIALAHNLMPQLLEAVELLDGVGDVRDMAELMNLWDHKIEPVLENLK